MLSSYLVSRVSTTGTALVQYKVVYLYIFILFQAIAFNERLPPLGTAQPLALQLYATTSLLYIKHSTGVARNEQ